MRWIRKNIFEAKHVFTELARWIRVLLKQNTYSPSLRGEYVFCLKNIWRIHLIKSKYLFYYFFLIKLWILFNFGNQQIWNITISNACIVWYEVDKYKYYSRPTMGLIFIYMNWLPHSIHIDNRSTYELHTTFAFIIPKWIKWWSAHNTNINIWHISIEQLVTWIYKLKSLAFIIYTQVHMTQFI